MKIDEEDSNVHGEDDTPTSAPKRLKTDGSLDEATEEKQVIRVKNSWGLLPHALESLVKYWSVSVQLNIHRTYCLL